jgi:hypothetical protein
MNAFSFLAQTLTPPSTGNDAVNIVAILVELAVAILVIVGVWKVFTKAGHPGWAALIPIYNAYIIIKIAGRPGWWLLLLFIPLVNVVIGIIVSIGVARNFGKGVAFGIGLAFLGIIFYPILGYGRSTYIPSQTARGFEVVPNA